MNYIGAGGGPDVGKDRFDDGRRCVFIDHDDAAVRFWAGRWSSRNVRISGRAFKRLGEKRGEQETHGNGITEEIDAILQFLAGSEAELQASDFGLQVWNFEVAVHARVGIGTQPVGTGECRLRLDNGPNLGPKAIGKLGISAEKLKKTADVRHAQGVLHIAIDLENAARRLGEW